jgi:hypothetical protein
MSIPSPLWAPGAASEASPTTSSAESKDYLEVGPENVPIAVVGMSFRFPDGATSAESLWKMLVQSRCASKEFPADRLNGHVLYNPDPSRGDSVRLNACCIRHVG